MQLYINSITRCIGIVDILSTRRRDHQWNNLIKFETLFYKSVMYKLQQHSTRLVSSSKARAISNPKRTIFLNMNPPPLLWLQIPVLSWSIWSNIWIYVYSILSKTLQTTWNIEAVNRTKRKNIWNHTRIKFSRSDKRYNKYDQIFEKHK